MVEDSMKNIRQSKALGLKTILVAGKGRKQRSRLAAQAEGKLQEGADASELTKPGDAPLESDPGKTS